MRSNQLNTTPGKRGIGITIHDVNIASGLSADSVQQIQDLLNRYRVVAFPDQTLTDAQLQGFADFFGPPFIPDKKFPVLGSNDSTNSVVVVGNQAHEYKNAYLGHQEVLPHSDHQWLESPSAASVLYAIDIESDSAPTIWFDMVEAYRLLDAKTRDLIQNLEVITYNPFYRPFGTVSAKYVDRLTDIPPGDTFPHPLVRVHPVTNEKILYLNVAYEMEFVGLPYATGAELFLLLQDHIKNLKSYYQHHWAKGDFVFWDNRATIHYRPSFNATVRRVLKRVTIGGEKPF